MAYLNFTPSLNQMKIMEIRTSIDEQLNLDEFQWSGLSSQIGSRFLDVEAGNTTEVSITV